MPARPASPAASTILRGDAPPPRAIAGAIGVMTSSTKPAMRPASPVPSMSVDTDERGLALGDPAADPGSAVSAAPAAQFVEQRHEYPGSTRTDGVADRYPPAVDVDLVRIHLEHPGARDGDRRKSLVDLHQVEHAGVHV